MGFDRTLQVALLKTAVRISESSELVTILWPKQRTTWICQLELRRVSSKSLWLIFSVNLIVWVQPMIQL